MSTTALINLAIVSSNRKDIVAALKASNAYTGVARYNLTELRAYATVAQVIRIAGLVEGISKVSISAQADFVAAEAAKVVEVMIEQAIGKPAKADRKPRGTNVRPSDSPLRGSTIVKLGQAIAQGTKQDDGTVLCTADAFVAAGLGASWVRETNSNWAEGAYYDAAASQGYTGHSSRGTVVFTPIVAVAADVEAAG